MTLRTFIAVELPDPVRREVAALQAQLKRTNADVRWVEPENLHLTLKFLGDIEEGQVSALKEALVAAIKGRPSFTLQLEGIGAFPKTTFPRVIWVRVHSGEKELSGLAADVEQACAGLGLAAEERPFSAHLTIGRVAAARGSRTTNPSWRVAAAGGSGTTNPSWRVRSQTGLARLVKALQVAEFRAETPAPINRLILFQSALSPRGPIYTPLAEIPLTPQRPHGSGRP